LILAYLQLIFLLLFWNTVVYYICYYIWCHQLIIFGCLLERKGNTRSLLMHDIFSDVRSTGEARCSERGCVTYNVCKKISAFVRSDSSLSQHCPANSSPRRRSRSWHDVCLFLAFVYSDDEMTMPLYIIPMHLVEHTDLL